jgi:hypothetical protein
MNNLIDKEGKFYGIRMKDIATTVAHSRAVKSVSNGENLYLTTACKFSFLHCQKETEPNTDHGKH